MSPEQRKMHTPLPLHEFEYSYIGLTQEVYNNAIVALQSHDIAVLKEIVSLTPKRIQTVDTQKGSVHYDVARIQFQNGLAQSATEGFIPQEKPIITFLAGPIGSGKSSLKDELIDSADTVETNPDNLRTKILPGYDKRSPQDVVATQNESMTIAQKILDIALEKKLDIVCETTLRDKEWVRDTCQVALQKGYTTKIIFLHKKLDRCFNDTSERGERPISLPLLLSCVHGYENLAQLVRENVFSSVSVYDTTDAKNGTIELVHAPKDNFDQNSNIQAIIEYARKFLPAIEE